MDSQRCCLGFLLVMFMFNLKYSVAQDFTGRFGLGAFGAAVKMVGGEIDRSTIDQWAGVRMKYAYSPMLAFEANVGYGWVYARDPKGSQFKSVGGYKTLLFPINTNLIINPLPHRNPRPLLTLGAGLMQWDIRKLPPNSSVFSFGNSVKGNRINATLLGGLGFEFSLNDDIVAELCFKYHRILKGDEDTMGAGDDANKGITELRLALTYFWGGFKDTDGDGIEDKLDLDKYNPEDIDGFKDEDGIPDLDNDEDGILDDMDQAPNVAEDIDGFQDDDGIPDLDNDNDNISDKLDKCMNLKEDWDGFEDQDGCPEYDNDNDSIPDSLDQCPNWPEDFNNYMDYDGCPDEKPEPSPVEKSEPSYKIGEKIILKEVSFATNRADLTDESYAIFDELIKVLLKYPDMEIEIHGYTDDVGDWNYNQQLSEKRAQAVKQYLVNRGIAHNRIGASGFGEQNPIAPNTTKAGRAANRRIEVVRIK